MRIKKISITLFFVFLISGLAGCAQMKAIADSTGRYFTLANPPLNDPSDQCNNQVQEIARISKVSNPIDSIVRSLEGSFTKALKVAVLTGNFDVFLRSASASYLTHIMAKGGIRAFLTDINRDAGNQRQLNYAVKSLKRCRTSQTRRVARRIQRTPSREATQEKEKLLERAKRDDEYIIAVNENFGKRIALYEKTSNEISGSNATSEVRYINISSLNVRDRPTTNGSSVLGSLPRNAMIKVVENLGGWLKIDYQGQFAFVAKRFTRTTAPAKTRDVKKAIVSAKNTQKDIDKEREQLQIEMDAILGSHNIST